MKNIDRYIKNLKATIIHALEDVKALDIVVLDIAKLSSIADVMIIASGTSNRHVKALADNVVHEVKEKKIAILGVEGQRDCEWVLIDLGDAIVHVMLPRVREFYNLEKLWSVAEESEFAGIRKAG